MSWTAPRTWVTGEVPSAATMNAHIRDNLRAMVWQYANVETSQTRTATAYGDLTTVGPAVTLATNTEALVFIGSQNQNDTAGQHSITSYAVSGDTTIAANDNKMFDFESSAANQRRGSGRMSKETALTPGSNTFTAKYRVTGGTGTFLRRRILAAAVGPA